MKLGFIGCGNMARAMIGGILKKGLYRPEEILVYDLSEEALESAVRQFGVKKGEGNPQLASLSDFLVLAVKPQFYEQVLSEIRDELTPRQVVITLAPGKELSWLSQRLKKGQHILRTMPNTPAMVGEGITAVCPNEEVTSEQFSEAVKILESFGQVQKVPERLIDAVVAVSGSSPAYVYLFIEALADGAVAEGMPREQAYAFAAQAVLGSAKMVLETGKHPGELKDMVCSPGGTTIEAVRALEQTGFRGSVLEAMRVCAEKSRSM